MKKSLFFLFFVLISSVSCAEDVLTLDKAISGALANNEQITIAQKKAESAQAKVSQAFSGFWPSIALSSNYARSFSSPIISEFRVGGIDTDVVFGFNEPSDVKSWKATLNQNLFTFGKLENALLIALDGAQAAKEEYRRAKQDVIYDTINAYFNVIKAVRMSQYAQESVDMARAHMEQVENMLKVGMAVKSDLLRSEVAFLSAKQNLIKAENSVELAKSVFNKVTGSGINDAVSIADSDFESFDKAEYRTYPQLLEDAYKYRPDWKQVKYSLSMSEKNLNMSKANWLPSVVAQADYGWNNTNYSSARINYDQTNWTVAAAASWKIFDGFDTQSKIKEASAGLDESRANASLAKKAVELDVKQAYLNYISARDVIDTAQKALESARENFEAAELRFRNGLSTNIEVLDAQASLTKAEIDLITAQFDLCIARAQLRRSSGLLDLDYSDKKSFPKKISIEGIAEYIDIEGGFPGLTDAYGNKYNLTGPKAEEILTSLRTSGRQKIKVQGYLKDNGISFRMWGAVMYVDEYKFVL